MPTCRVVKESNYTKISNHYLRDDSLSFQAKGLLTLMLSLPEDWDYTIAGLTKFTSDGRVCVANTIRELEEHGYIRRKQNRGENGAFAQKCIGFMKCRRQRMIPWKQITQTRLKLNP